jgi:hypothetical protein
MGGPGLLPAWGRVWTWVVVMGVEVGQPRLMTTFASGLGQDRTSGLRGHVVSARNGLRPELSWSEISPVVAPQAVLGADRQGLAEELPDEALSLLRRGGLGRRRIAFMSQRHAGDPFDNVDQLVDRDQLLTADGQRSRMSEAVRRSVVSTQSKT